MWTSWRGAAGRRSAELRCVPAAAQVGTESDPGLMVLSMRDVFKHIQRETDKNWQVTCGYLEVRCGWVRYSVSGRRWVWHADGGRRGPGALTNRCTTRSCTTC